MPPLKGPKYDLSKEKEQDQWEKNCTVLPPKNVWVLAINNCVSEMKDLKEMRCHIKWPSMLLMFGHTGQSINKQSCGDTQRERKQKTRGRAC